MHVIVSMAFFVKCSRQRHAFIGGRIFFRPLHTACIYYVGLKPKTLIGHYVWCRKRKIDLPQEFRGPSSRVTKKGSENKSLRAEEVKIHATHRTYGWELVADTWGEKNEVSPLATHQFKINLRKKNKSSGQRNTHAPSHITTRWDCTGILYYNIFDMLDSVFILQPAICRILWFPLVFATFFFSSLFCYLSSSPFTRAHTYSSEARYCIIIIDTGRAMRHCVYSRMMPRISCKI